MFGYAAGAELDADLTATTSKHAHNKKKEISNKDTKRVLMTRNKFTNKDPLSVFLKPSTNFAEFKNTILQRLGLQGVKRVEKLFYRIPISVLRDDAKYDSFVISSDEDFQVLFHCRRQFPEVRTPELLAKLVDVVSSSGSSNKNPHSTGHPACSSSMPVGSSSVVLPATIADDSDDETPRTTPAVGRGASSSGTNQYPPHFSALDLDAMVGQQFQDKEEVVFSVETYSICRGVEYKVLESDHRKYDGKCKEFGSGCTWLIQVSLRQRKDIWEVKRYNGPYTYLATSISSDHKKLDYHVISAFILPMIRVDNHNI
ncbi:uncharacterized protein LOC107616168 [Arachis ipaensis]|uniref:uncharacterized protein LOC107616168 n=1 Tax=Arachis ipaensis TaxID=130454 RepID=UPI0007AF9C2C|nr:uncharacterized protein LOC107616168 [Arachis ipaensis]